MISGGLACICISIAWLETLQYRMTDSSGDHDIYGFKISPKKNIYIVTENGYAPFDHRSGSQRTTAHLLGGEVIGEPVEDDTTVIMKVDDDGDLLLGGCVRTQYCTRPPY